jgi:hypothetical protein
LNTRFGESWSATASRAGSARLFATTRTSFGRIVPYSAIVKVGTGLPFM